MATDRRAEEAKVMRIVSALAIMLMSCCVAQRTYAVSEPLNLVLPTENTALYSGGGSDFYQYVTRDFKGVKSTPWQGGKYGFVRNPVETSSGLLYTRFHEGVDIRPVRRDARGEPLDEVRAIADGTVVHVNLVPGYSNYGNYVVVEHRWDGVAYYSLYGHLARVTVQRGTRVNRGEQLGILGYTGDGLDRARAHMHFELNLMLSRNFEQWHQTFFKNEPNRHGLYNGINLTGIDVARLYLELRRRPSMSIPQFLADEETFYRVALPASPNFDLPKRYPWLLRDAKADAPAGSWEVSFNAAGVPLQVVPRETAVAAPTITYVKKRGGNYAGYTRGVIGGTGESPRLTDSGQRLMRLLTFPD
jgi:murein DD-endopeptidase MepM/ murein hydrolase activator NlpD